MRIPYNRQRWLTSSILYTLCALAGLTKMSFSVQGCAAAEVAPLSPLERIDNVVYLPKNKVRHLPSRTRGPLGCCCLRNG